MQGNDFSVNTCAPIDIFINGYVIQLKCCIKPDSARPG